MDTELRARSTEMIAGHEVTLVRGNHYIAYREMGTISPIIIKGYNTGIPAEVLYPKSYDEANEILNAFNNGATSFEGRIW